MQQIRRACIAWWPAAPVLSTAVTAFVHFPYEANTPGGREWQAALDYIRADSSLDEVILSGGDPLAVSDKQFAWLLAQLDAIPHL